MWWCNEILDELERQCASDEDLAEMASKERSILKCSSAVVAPTASTLVYRPKVLGFVLDAIRELAMPPNHFLFVVQVLDVTGLWVTCHDFRRQVVAATAALYMCVKLRDNPPERMGIDGVLPALVDEATWFLERTTNDNEPVLEEHVSREEFRLLDALNFEVTTATVAEWIEFLFKRTDVMTRKACTPLLRFAADAALEFVQVFLFQVQLSEETPGSAVALNAWLFALTLACQMAVVCGAERTIGAARVH